MEPKSVDPRTHITPEAFKVTPALLGTPLASPRRRAAALLVDLVLAALLAELGGFFIGLGIAIVFFRVATRRALDHPLKRWMRASFALMGALLLFQTQPKPFVGLSAPPTRHRRGAALSAGPHTAGGDPGDAGAPHPGERHGP